jgi:hypothetical protein
MKLYAPDNSVLMDISAIERKGNELVLKGKVFGSMPMTARVKPEEARSGLKLLGFRLGLFLLTFLFRSSSTPKKSSVKKPEK